jgi:thiol-disulfide isomerase/thioredoxin
MVTVIGYALRTTFLATLLAACLIGIAGESYSQELSPRIAAPSLPATQWLNSTPLALNDLREKVVLIDFWEYTCINCIRTFPWLRRWNKLYKPDGLVVIGVHTPEFAFARDPRNVVDAVSRFGFTFPIAIDSNYAIWNAFHNDAWPADYLIDRQGNIAYVHFGEGDYGTFEQEIRKLLLEANPHLDFTAALYNSAQRRR